MSNIAIKAENLSKAYQLGEIGTGTISRDLERWYARIRGKEDPFLRIGETNDRTSKGSSDIVWSLKDINFEIEQGDAVGIIGRNGAGKSTLLKVLSRVTSPTSGRITGKGRIASLLEVGTGFHPELTGRENIYLNGAILGMRKKEITRKFDEIVDFAGVERYIDTPVKRYSSGMYVRLAFAVAAHLESEILIVDEVLAVGDAEFQKKCLGKMGEVSKGEGRTVLFVSHNMDAVLSLTNHSLLLDRGKGIIFSNTNEVISKYLSKNDELDIYFNDSSKKEIYFRKIFLTKNTLVYDEPLTINMSLFSLKQIRGLSIGLGIYNSYDEYVGNVVLKNSIHLNKGITNFKINVTQLNLIPGKYKCVFAISRNETFDIYDTVIGSPLFTLINDLNDSFLFSKWSKNWGHHYLTNVSIHETEDI